MALLRTAKATQQYVVAGSANPTKIELVRPLSWLSPSGQATVLGSTVIRCLEHGTTFATLQLLHAAHAVDDGVLHHVPEQYSTALDPSGNPFGAFSSEAWGAGQVPGFDPNTGF